MLREEFNPFNHNLQLLQDLQNVSENILPLTDSAIDLGSSTKYFNYGYVNNLLAKTRLQLPSNTSNTTEGNIRYNSTTKQAEFYNGTAWKTMGIPTNYEVTVTSVAEGSRNVTGLSNKFLIKYLKIATTSTNWTLTLYQKDNYSTAPLEVITARDGNFTAYLDLPWQDQDSTGELHYNFTSASGSETHDITVYAEERV
jgi:hypothetical protein